VKLTDLPVLSEPVGLPVTEGTGGSAPLPEPQIDQAIDALIAWLERERVPACWCMCRIVEADPVFAVAVGQIKLVYGVWNPLLLQDWDEAEVPDDPPLIAVLTVY